MANFNLGNLAWKITADSAQFVRGLNASDKQLKTFSDRAAKVGGTLTKFVTLPLIGAGGVAVKFASDLAESTNAVNVVFGEAAGTIAAFGETAADSAGLTQQEWNETAAILGTLLKQTGGDINDVAEQTSVLGQRAADVGSIFNASAKEVSGAFGAALRGESEPIRRFGVLLNEAAVQAKAVELGLADVGGAVSDAAKVQARYALILEQTSEFAGDFANTNEGAANSLRVIRAQAVNLAADLGRELLPIVEDVLGVVRQWTDRFGELDDNQKRLIVTIAAVAAATGPLIQGIVATTSAIRVLNTAALWGPLGVVAGLVALAGAMALIIKRRKELKEEELAERFGDIADATGETVKNIDLLNTALRQQEQLGNSAADAINQIAEGWGIAHEEVARIVLTNDDLSESYKEQAREILRQHEAIKENNDGYYATAELNEQIAGWQADGLAITEELQGTIEDINDLLAQRIVTLQNIDALVAAGAITEEEGLERKIDLRNQEIGAIIAAAEAGEISANDAKRQIDDQREAIERYYDRLGELTDDADERQEESLSLIELKWKRQTELAENYAEQERKRAEEREQRLEEERQLVEDLAKAYTTQLLSGFEAVGEALVNNENAYQALGKAALGTLAEILRALGAELAARAAVAALSGNVGGAVVSGVASAAAFTAAGAISAGAANIGSESAPTTTPSAPATSRDTGGAPLSAATPTGGGGGNVINFTQNNIVNLDTDENIAEAARVLFPALQAEGRRIGESI